MLIVLFIVLCIIYYVIDNENHATQPQSMLLVGIMGSMMITTLQQMGVFSFLSIDWENPIKFILNLARLLQFDMDILRMGCVITLSALGRFMAKLGAILVALLTVLLIHFTWVIVRHKGAFRLPSLIGVMGSIFMVFLISIVNTTILPLQCIEHPNGLKTVRSYPTIICWEEDEHAAIVGAGIVFMLIPLGFVAGCCCAAYQFPKRMQAMDTEYLHTFAFLFFRFRPDSYWFVVFFIVRNLMIALTPTLPPGAVLLLVLKKKPTISASGL